MEQDTYETTDFFLATALIAGGHNPVGFQKDSGGNKVEWSFAETADMQSVIKGYFNNSLKLPIHDIFSAQRLLKQQIRSLFTTLPR